MISEDKKGGRSCRRPFGLFFLSQGPGGLRGGKSSEAPASADPPARLKAFLTKIACLKTSALRRNCQGVLKLGAFAGGKNSRLQNCKLKFHTFCAEVKIRTGGGRRFRRFSAEVTAGKSDFRNFRGETKSNNAKSRASAQKSRQTNRYHPAKGLV